MKSILTKALLGISACYTLYNLTWIVHLHFQNETILQELNKHFKHRMSIESDKEWIRFRRPEDGLKYMVIWLFYQLEFPTLRILGEIDCEGIKCTSIEVTCNKKNIKEKLDQIVSQVPFGLIKVRKPDSEKVIFDWYSSIKLPVNANISKVQDKIFLDLKSVLLTDAGYQINLNDEWFINTKELFNKIKILKVNPKSIIISIPTPNGLIKRELKQGILLEVDYYCI